MILKSARDILQDISKGEWIEVYIKNFEKLMVFLKFSWISYSMP